MVHTRAVTAVARLCDSRSMLAVARVRILGNGHDGGILRRAVCRDRHQVGRVVQEEDRGRLSCRDNILEVLYQSHALGAGVCLCPTYQLVYSLVLRACRTGLWQMERMRNG